MLNKNIKDIPVFSRYLSPTIPILPEVGEFYDIDLIPGELDRVIRENRLSIEERLQIIKKLPQFGPTEM